MNEILTRTSQALMQKVNPKLVPAVTKVVAAGRRIMYSDQTRQMAVQQLKQAKDPASIGAVVAKLAAVLMNQAHGTIPPSVLFPAAMQLLMEALGFLEEAGAVQITTEFLAQCTQELGSAFLQVMGVTPDKLDQMMANKGAPAQPEAPAQPATPPAGIVEGA